MHNSKCIMHNLLRSFCILHCAFVIAGCSIPNLESPECTEARTAVKQFYSFHFGNDTRPSRENLKLRERFVTPEFYASLPYGGTTDVFTGSAEPPTTFKVGECKTLTPTTVDFQIQIYWRTDASTMQKELHVVAVKRDAGWLINNVSN
jgi:hypothetical protein